MAALVTFATVSIDRTTQDPLTKVSGKNFDTLSGISLALVPLYYTKYSIV